MVVEPRLDAARESALRSAYQVVVADAKANKMTPQTWATFRAEQLRNGNPRPEDLLTPQQRAAASGGPRAAPNTPGYDAAGLPDGTTSYDSGSHSRQHPLFNAAGISGKDADGNTPSGSHDDRPAPIGGRTPPLMDSGGAQPSGSHQDVTPMGGSRLPLMPSRPQMGGPLPPGSRLRGTPANPDYSAHQHLSGSHVGGERTLGNSNDIAGKDAYGRTPTGSHEDRYHAIGGRLDPLMGTGGAPPTGSHQGDVPIISRTPGTPMSVGPNLQDAPAGVPVDTEGRTYAAAEYRAARNNDGPADLPAARDPLAVQRSIQREPNGNELMAGALRETATVLPVIEVSSLPDVGASNADKLAAAGVRTIQELASAEPSLLARRSGIDHLKVMDFIRQAQAANRATQATMPDAQSVAAARAERAAAARRPVATTPTTTGGVDVEDVAADKAKAAREARVEEGAAARRAATTPKTTEGVDAEDVKAAREAKTTDEEAAEVAEEEDQPESDGTSLTTISGIGTSTAKKLSDAGVATVEALAKADAEALAEETEFAPEKVADWVAQAKKAVAKADKKR